MDRPDQNKPLTSREKGTAFREYDSENKTPDYTQFINNLRLENEIASKRIRDLLASHSIRLLNSPRESDLEGIDNPVVRWKVADKSGEMVDLSLPLNRGTDFDNLRKRLGDEAFGQIISLDNTLTNSLVIEIALRRYFINKFGEMALTKDKYDSLYLLKPAIIVQQLLFLLFDGQVNEAETFLVKVLSANTTAELYNIITTLPKIDREQPKMPSFRANYYFHSTRSNIDEIREGLGRSERALNFNAGTEWDITNKYVEGQYNHPMLAPHTTMVFSRELIELFCYLFGSLSGGWGGESEVSIRVPRNLKIPWRDVAVRISEYKK